MRNAARLAVYDEMRISVKNHQTEPTIRPEMERGEMSQPCCINAPRANQNEFRMLNSLTVACGTASGCSPVSRPNVFPLSRLMGGMKGYRSN